MLKWLATWRLELGHAAKRGIIMWRGEAAQARQWAWRVELGRASQRFEKKTRGTWQTNRCTEMDTTRTRVILTGCDLPSPSLLWRRLEVHMKLAVLVQGAVCRSDMHHAQEPLRMERNSFSPCIVVNLCCALYVYCWCLARTLVYRQYSLTVLFCVFFELMW